MTALLTDHYELTMLRSFVADGMAHAPATFEAFARRLPRGRRFGLLLGTGRLLELIRDFTFAAEEVDWLLDRGIVDDATAAYLAAFRFSGSIRGYREGDLYLPHSPVLTVDAPLGEALLLETLILSVLNHDTAVGSAAARMVLAAGGAGLIEMGSRRTHERSAVAAARAAYVAGFDTSSNLRAGFDFGVPTAGTAAHAFVLAYPGEAEAFAAQVAQNGPSTTLLIDTYDTAEGVRRAIAAGGRELGAVRIDSGDLGDEARAARSALDRAGSTATRIVATGDLDEHRIEALVAEGAPIDAFGVGTELVAGTSHRTPGFVYKLVAIEDSSTGRMRPVAKQSIDKVSVGGRKTVRRGLRDGVLVREQLVVDPHDDEVEHLEDALRSEGLVVEDPTRPYVTDGVLGAVPEVGAARERAVAALAALPVEARLLSDGEPFATAQRRPAT